MSRTDKNRPYFLKLAEVERADPYGTKREAFIMWRPGLHGCAHSCWMCRGSSDERRASRREGKRQARNWDKEY